MTRLMFILNIFTYIVIAGCLDHRKVSITKTTKRAYKLKPSSQHSLLALDVLSLLFVNGLNYSMWTTYHGLSLRFFKKKYLRMWTNLNFLGYLDLYLE